MTAKAALAIALLEGRVLSVSNCFKEIGLTNIAREIPRMIEQPFGVEVSRTPKTGKSRYGQSVSYVNYRLNRTEHNQEGILKMIAYVESQRPKNEKTESEASISSRIKQLSLL
jgi:hypothetical protein